MWYWQVPECFRMMMMSCPKKSWQKNCFLMRICSQQYRMKGSSRGASAIPGSSHWYNNCLTRMDHIAQFIVGFIKGSDRCAISICNDTQRLTPGYGMHGDR